MTRVMKKLHNERGMTLSETLMAVLIMSIIFTAVAGGVVVMKNNYDKVTKKAQAQVLLATGISAINAELESATSVKLSGTPSDSGVEAKCFYSSRKNMLETLKNTDDKTSVAFYSTDAKGDPTETNRPIVTDAASIKMGLHLELVGANTSDTCLLKFYGNPESESDSNCYFEYRIAVKDKSGTVIEAKPVRIRPISNIELRD